MQTSYLTMLWSRGYDESQGCSASKQLTLHSQFPQPRRPSERTRKEVPKPRGLRAKILVRHLDLRAKMRGGVPRPARIIEDPTGEGHEIGVPRADDRFRLFKISNQTHGDDR